MGKKYHSALGIESSSVARNAACNMVSYLKVPLGNLQELDALGRVNDLSGEDLMCLNSSFS